MKDVQLVYTKTSVKNLKKLEKKISLRILKKIEENAYMNNPLERAKMLVGLYENTYRYRIGDYRVIFEYNESGKIIVLIVLTIKHRKGVYSTL